MAVFAATRLPSAGAISVSAGGLGGTTNGALSIQAMRPPTLAPTCTMHVGEAGSDATGTRHSGVTRLQATNRHCRLLVCRRPGQDNAATSASACSDFQTITTFPSAIATAGRESVGAAAGMSTPVISRPSRTITRRRARLFHGRTRRNPNGGSTAVCCSASGTRPFAASIFPLASRSSARYGVSSRSCSRSGLIVV